MKMPKYRFEDIAYNITQKRKPTSDDMKTYIGLEHLDSGSLSVTRWGSDVPIKGDKLQMQKGDILFGKRNAYLRRAAIAPHDGLFSAHGMILRPNEKVISRKLFPFFICSDYFFDAAIRISVGSLSPTINWSALKELEFVLPDMNEQEKLADLLWAANNTKEAYKKLLYLTDELVKSQFIEMFASGQDFPVRLLSEVSTVTGGLTKNSKREKCSLRLPYLRVANVFFNRLDLSEMLEIGLGENELKKVMLKSGDLLFVEGNGSTEQIGRVAVWNGEIAPCVHQNHLIKARFDDGLVIPTFALFYFMSREGRKQILERAVSTSGLYTLSVSKISTLQIPLPQIALQEQFATFVQQTDKSKFELTQNINNLEITIKALMSKNFG